MNKKEILLYLKDQIINESGNPDDTDTAPDVKYDVITSHGGEGQGNLYYYILKVNSSDGTFLVKVQGHYDSYEGVSWESGKLYEVEEYQKTITDYRKVT